MYQVTVTRIGNSEGIILPKELLVDLNAGKGDKLFLTKAPGGYALTPYDEEFTAQMEAAETIMRENRDVLRKLAE